MCRQFFALWVLAGMLFTTSALAAPKHVTAVYSVTKDGQPFATIIETFKQEEGRYYIDSVTEGIGVYGLFGKRRMVSSGDVTPAGLRPRHFEQLLGDDQRRAISADFDWSARNLVTKVKGKTSNIALTEGTQDLLSFTYQLMFQRPVSGQISMPVTTGKKLKMYHYKVTDKHLRVETTAGTFRTIHLANSDADGDESKMLWLGVDQHNIVVRLSMKDENGTRLEQTLASLHVE